MVLTKKFVHFFGGKFKPWGASKWTKFLSGTLSKWLAGLGVALTVLELAMNKKHQEEMKQHREALNRNFNEMESGVDTMLNESMEASGGVVSSLKQMLKDVENREQEQQKLQEHKKELLVQLQQVKRHLEEI